MNQAEAVVSAQNEFSIGVVYNGVEKKLEVKSHQTVRAVLEHAIRLFSINTQPHVLSLFTMQGQELPETISVTAAGLREGSVVYLRQSAVKGG